MANENFLPRPIRLRRTRDGFVFAGRASWREYLERNPRVVCSVDESGRIVKRPMTADDLPRDPVEPS